MKGNYLLSTRVSVALACDVTNNFNHNETNCLCQKILGMSEVTDKSVQMNGFANIQLSWICYLRPISSISRIFLQTLQFRLLVMFLNIRVNSHLNFNVFQINLWPLVFIIFGLRVNNYIQDIYFQEGHILSLLRLPSFLGSSSFCRLSLYSRLSIFLRASSFLCHYCFLVLFIFGVIFIFVVVFMFGARFH